MSSAWTLILQWADYFGSGGECRRYANVLIADPAHIAIVGESSRSTECQQLYNSLKGQVSQLQSNSSNSIYCGIAQLLSCLARGEPTCRSVLVVLLTDRQISTQLEALMNQWLSQRPANSIVLPVLPIGADPTVVLPPPLDQLIVLWDRPLVDMLAADILKTAGIGSDEFRLFISYRRKDCIALADQLFDAFSQAGFDVFLDRFRGTPGRNFPPLLNEFLIDKGMVLVLESPSVHQSPWTKAEVQFASNFRLGLMSLRMPNGQFFSTIPTRDRFDATDPNLWNDTLGNQPTSTLNDTTSIVQFVRERYALQTFRRRVYLESLLGMALATEGLTSTRQTNGVHRISTRQHYLVELSSRCPALNNVRRVCETNRTTKDQQVVVGPHGYASPQNASNMAWLTGHVQVSLDDEANMIGLARAIKQGQSKP